MPVGGNILNPTLVLTQTGTGGAPLVGDCSGSVGEAKVKRRGNNRFINLPIFDPKSPHMLLLRIL